VPILGVRFVRSVGTIRVFGFDDTNGLDKSYGPNDPDGLDDPDDPDDPMCSTT